MAFYNFPHDFDFNVNIENFITQLQKSYISKGTDFNINYRWLHETVVKWQTNVENSDLFKDDEAGIILPIWILYFYNLLKSTNTHCFNTFTRTVIREFKEKSYLYNEELNNWSDMLLKQNEPEMMYYDFEDEQMEMENENESIREESQCPDGSISTVQSYNSLFLIKCNFMLDLLAPNRFQYAILRAVLNPPKNMEILNNLNIQFPYYLQFFTKNFLQMARKSLVINEEEFKLKLLPLKEAMEVPRIFENIEEYLKYNTVEEPIDDNNSKRGSSVRTSLRESKRLSKNRARNL